MEVMRLLLTKWPRKPIDADLRQIKAMQRKQDVEEEFLNMFGDSGADRSEEKRWNIDKLIVLSNVCAYI